MSCFPFPERKEFDSAFTDYISQGHNAKVVDDYLNENRELLKGTPLALHINVKSMNIHSLRHCIRKEHTILSLRVMNQRHPSIPPVVLPLSKYIPRLAESSISGKADALRHFLVGELIVDETVMLNLPITGEEFLQAYLAGDSFYFTLDILGYVAPYSDANYRQRRERFAFAYFALSPVMITRNQAMVSRCELLSDPITAPILANRFNTLSFGQRYNIRQRAVPPPPSGNESQVIGEIQVLTCFGSALSARSQGAVPGDPKT